MDINLLSSCCIQVISLAMVDIKIRFVNTDEKYAGRDSFEC